MKQSNYRQLIAKIVELCLGGLDSLRISMVLRVPHEMVLETLLHCFTNGDLILDKEGFPTLVLS
jgi:hypothetical protein